MPLSPGDLFVFYSDGVTEARNPEGELFGSGRLVETVVRHRELEADALARSIHDAVVAFSGGSRLADDLTCVVVRAPGPAPAATADTAALDLASSLEELVRLRAHLAAVFAHPPASILGEEARRELVLAVDEAFVNIVRHAYRGRPDGVVRLETEATPAALTVRFRHGVRWR